MHTERVHVCMYVCSLPHMRHRVMSLSKTHLLPTVLVKPRKSWLRPEMTEKLLTWTLSLNTNKQTNKCM